MSHHYPEVVKRLTQVEGHVRGIKDMADAGKTPADLLHQISAVQAALRKIAQLVVDDHLDHCAEAIDEGNAQEQIQSLKSALASYMR
jgi:DNA-binding FrmR family transcriptional regulator